MRIVHLMASPFFGGPERQVLGLARHLPAQYASVFLSFAEGGRCRPFLDEARRHGFEAHELKSNAPRYRRAVAEIAGPLRELRADLVCCSGYKPDILGGWAARRVGIPAVSISHGWTAATWKVRLNEALDRRVIRWMDAVVCVSESQADKVRRAGVTPHRIAVIRNAVDAAAFAAPDAEYAAKLRGLFARPRWIVGAAGRLSPEKGFTYLVEAARLVRQRRPEAGFVIFGDGPLRGALTEQIARLGLGDAVVLAGFRGDVGKFLPHLDLAVLPSLTEGLPVILLEAFAAGVPVVATAVGGIPEVVEQGRSGALVVPGDAAALAEGISALLEDDVNRPAMGRAGRERVRREFSFAVQSEQYLALFDRLTAGREPLPGRGEDVLPALAASGVRQL